MVAKGEREGLVRDGDGERWLGLELGVRDLEEGVCKGY